MSDALKLIDRLTGYDLGNAAPSAREIVDDLAAAGYVLVPIKPTQQMLEAGAKGSGEDSEDVAVGAWESMVAVGRVR